MSKDRTLNVDLGGALRPLDRTERRCIASGHAYTLLREDHRNHIRRIQREIGFEQLRFHGIFHDLVGIYCEDHDGSGYQNFQNLDKIYDFLLEEGIRPFVELGFMPARLASGPETCFQYRGHTTPPRDYARWRDLVSGFCRHLIDRYGLEEVRSWNFEVWNEPNLEYFWTGGQEGYFQLYQASAEAIKSVDADLRVGGPATARNEWVGELIDYCNRKDVPIDFATTHHYCASAVLEMGQVDRRIQYRGAEAYARDIRDVLEEIRNSARPDLPLCYTEWNVSPCHGDTIGKDSEFTACFVLDHLARTEGLLEANAFWTISDIFEESGPGLDPFSGKYGLLNLHGIAKPVYHAFRFRADLFDTRLETACPWALATRNSRGDLRLLSWNLTEPSQCDFGGGEWHFPEGRTKQTIRLNNLHGTYRVQSWSVDGRNGNSFRAWQEMGKPRYLDQEQIAQLGAASEPSLESERIVKCDSSLELIDTLESNAIRYYRLEKIV